MGLLEKASAKQQEELESSQEPDSPGGLLRRSEEMQESPPSSSPSSSGGLLHHAEEMRESSPSSSSSSSGGLLHRAEEMREHEPGEAATGTEATGIEETTAPRGLFGRARAMREGMKGLLQRAREFREKEATSETNAEGIQEAQSAESPIQKGFSNTDRARAMDKASADATEVEDSSAPQSPAHGVEDDRISIPDGHTIEADSSLDESVEFLDEDEFADIAREAEETETYYEGPGEPDISEEVLRDFEEISRQSSQLQEDEEEPQEPAFISEDSPGDGDEWATDTLAGSSVEAEEFPDGVAEEDLQAAERNSEADLVEEFPDLDLEYRMPDEGDDPAKPGKEVGEEQAADPFLRWEQEALEQAEQEAKTLRAEDDRATQEQSFLYEDTHPMTTLPAEAHIASQRKIDHYMALFDLLRELQDVQELEEFWESLAYALLGQLAAGKVLIFAPRESGKDKPFYPVASLGISPPEDWILQPGQEIYDTLAQSPEIHYAQEFQKPTSTTSDLEKSILEKGSVQVLAPIGQQGRMEGLIFLGANMEGVDYTLDDLEYLKLLGEMSSGSLQRIRARVKREEQAERNEARVKLYERILNASHEASQVKNLDDVYDVLLSHLKEDFGVQSASLVLLNVQQQEYRIFAGNEISPESLERFRLPVGSELIGTVSNLTRLYDFASFRDNQEITSCYSNDDLALMQNYWIIPLINLNWLVGFITIHRTSRPWSEFDRELVLATSEFFAPILANSIILGERETLFRDPFSPVVERLKKELNRAAQFQTPVSLVEVRVKNLKRLLSLNEPDSVTGFLQDLSRSLSGLLFDSDFLARVGQGRFALILPGRNRQEADIFVRKIQAEFKRLNLLARSPVDVQYSFQSVTAPEEADEAEKMLAYLDP